MRHSGAKWACMAALVLTACYHQVVDTGLPAGETRIAKPWTSTWIFGLVPATPIDVRSQCPNGVAIVDTQMSFVNGLVGAITLGIYTPLSVTVTCSGAGAAAGPAVREIRADVSSPDAMAAAFESAARLSRDSGQPVALVWSSGDASLTR